MAERAMTKRPVRWHIAVFLAPAVLVYTAIMILPLFGTLQLSLFRDIDGSQIFVGLENFRTLFGDPRWSDSFWNALGNNTWFFIVHMLVQNPIGIALAAFIVAAESIGLGCCPLSAIRNHSDALSDLLGVPDHVFAIAQEFAGARLACLEGGHCAGITTERLHGETASRHELRSRFGREVFEAPLRHAPKET